MKVASISYSEIHSYSTHMTLTESVNSRHSGGPGVGGDFGKEARLVLRPGS